MSSAREASPACEDERARQSHGTVPPSAVTVTGHLDHQQAAAVQRLAEAAQAADGEMPLSEHVRLHLRHGGEGAKARNVLLTQQAPGGRAVTTDLGPEQLIGYGHLDVTDLVEGPSAELVVHPAHRRRGHGRALVGRLLTESASVGDGRLRLWAHGHHPGARRLAESMGFELFRELWQMRRASAAPLPEVRIPPGVRVRPFRPGADDEEWVALNARAFADHPEQGRLALADLHRRMAEPWFDPDGFLIAERQTGSGWRMVGFHWTKVHDSERDAEEDRAHGHPPIGEVYVVGVAPDAQGGGLGGMLVLVGLRHLAELGLAETMLYVDADNVAAVQVYTRLGFTRSAVDVMYRYTPLPGRPA